MEKLSVSLPDLVAERARRAAEAAGVPLSTWLAEAAEAAADLADARAAAAEYVSTFGEPDPADVASIRGKLTEAGVGMPESDEEVLQRRAAVARLLGLPSDRIAG